MDSVLFGLFFGIMAFLLIAVLSLIVWVMGYLIGWFLLIIIGASIGVGFYFYLMDKRGQNDRLS